MGWYVDTSNWTVHHVTAATAQANGWYGPYPTQAAAQAAANQGAGGTGGGGQGSPPAASNTWWVVENQQHLYKEVNSATKPSGGGIIRVWGPLTKAQADRLLQPGGIAPYQAPGISVHSLAGVSNFFHTLTEKNTWIRVAEIVLGGALLLIALAKLAGNTQVGKAAKSIATKAAIL